MHFFTFQIGQHWRAISFSFRKFSCGFRDTATYLANCVPIKIPLYLRSTGYVSRNPSRTLHIRKIPINSLYIFASLNAFLVFLIVTWTLDQHTENSEAQFKPKILLSATPQNESEGLMGKDCSFGQVESFETGYCQWTPTWTHIDKNELYKDVADARLSLVESNLGQGHTELALRLSAHCRYFTPPMRQACQPRQRC